MSGTTHRRFRLSAALGAAAVLALAGCSSTAGSTSGEGQTGFITGKGDGVDTAAAGSRQAAPDVSGASLDGGKISLSDYKGKIVVLNVWGSWCNPCRLEAQGLQQVSQKYQGQGVQFLGINTRDTDPANAVAFEKAKGITYPSIYDPDGTQILKFPKGSLPPESIPTTLVVDRQGRLAARALGARSAEQLEAMLKPILAEQQ